MKTIEEVRNLLQHISFSLFGQKLYISAAYDKKAHKGAGFFRRSPFPRVYIQVFYHAPCTKTGQVEEWKDGKHYLSTHMTEDEIVKKAWAAIQQAVHHEVMEGFKFDNKILFNPHVDFRKLLEVSDYEITRQAPTNFDV